MLVWRIRKPSMVARWSTLKSRPWRPFPCGSPQARSLILLWLRPFFTTSNVSGDGSPLRPKRLPLFLHSEQERSRRVIEVIGEGGCGGRGGVVKWGGGCGGRGGVVKKADYSSEEGLCLWERTSMARGIWSQPLGLCRWTWAIAWRKTKSSISSSQGVSSQWRSRPIW